MNKRRITAYHQGFIQIIPMVILAVAAITSFVLIGTVQKDQQDVRSKAAITCTRRTPVTASCQLQTYRIQDGVCVPEQCFITSGSANTPTKAPTKSPTKAPTKTPTVSPECPAGWRVPQSRLLNICDGDTSTTNDEWQTFNGKECCRSGPTKAPTKAPTKTPTKAPTNNPTKTPTKTPTKAPTTSPTKIVTKTPTKAPTTSPLCGKVNQDCCGGGYPNGRCDTGLICSNIDGGTCLVRTSTPTRSTTTTKTPSRTPTRSTTTTKTPSRTPTRSTTTTKTPTRKPTTPTITPKPLVNTYLPPGTRCGPLIGANTCDQCQWGNKFRIAWAGKEGGRYCLDSSGNIPDSIVEVITPVTQASFGQHLTNNTSTVTPRPTISCPPGQSSSYTENECTGRRGTYRAGCCLLPTPVKRNTPTVTPSRTPTQRPSPTPLPSSPGCPPGWRKPQVYFLGICDGVSSTSDEWGTFDGVHCCRSTETRPSSTSVCRINNQPGWCQTSDGACRPGEIRVSAIVNTYNICAGSGSICCIMGFSGTPASAAALTPILTPTHSPTRRPTNTPITQNTLSPTRGPTSRYTPTPIVTSASTLRQTGQSCMYNSYPGTCLADSGDCNSDSVNIFKGPGNCATGVCCSVKPVTNYQNRPGLGQSCMTSGGWPGTCKPNDECADGNAAWTAHVAWDKPACVSGGCCGYEPENKPGKDETCTVTIGWSGTCRLNKDCNQSDPNIAFQDNVCDGSYGCCAFKPTPMPTIATTPVSPTRGGTPRPSTTPVLSRLNEPCELVFDTAYWPGTCVAKSNCREGRDDIAWGKGNCAEEGCCAIEPQSRNSNLPQQGEHCMTSSGWPGTCTYASGCAGGHAATTAGVSYDTTACATGGCCGVKPEEKPDIGDRCQVTMGWWGTCKTNANCDQEGNDNVEFQDNVCSGGGCCAERPTPTPTRRITQAPTLRPTTSPRPSLSPTPIIPAVTPQPRVALTGPKTCGDGSYKGGEVVLGSGSQIYECNGQTGLFVNRCKDGYTFADVTRKGGIAETDLTAQLANLCGLQAQQPQETRMCGNTETGGLPVGTIAIGPQYEGSNRWKCIADGGNGYPEWEKCPGCILTRVPAYLQNDPTYQAEVQAYRDRIGDASDVFSQRYELCRSQGRSESVCQTEARNAMTTAGYSEEIRTEVLHSVEMSNFTSTEYYPLLEQYNVCKARYGEASCVEYQHQLTVLAGQNGVSSEQKQYYDTEGYSNYLTNQLVTAYVEAKQAHDACEGEAGCVDRTTQVLNFPGITAETRESLRDLGEFQDQYYQTNTELCVGVASCNPDAIRARILASAQASLPDAYQGYIESVADNYERRISMVALQGFSGEMQSMCAQLVRTETDQERCATDLSYAQSVISPHLSVTDRQLAQTHFQDVALLDVILQGDDQEIMDYVTAHPTLRLTCENSVTCRAALVDKLPATWTSSQAPANLQPLVSTLRSVEAQTEAPYYQAYLQYTEEHGHITLDEFNRRNEEAFQSMASNWNVTGMTEQYYNQYQSGTFIPLLAQESYNAESAGDRFGAWWDRTIAPFTFQVSGVPEEVAHNRAIGMYDSLSEQTQLQYLDSLTQTSGYQTWQAQNPGKPAEEYLLTQLTKAVQSENDYLSAGVVREDNLTQFYGQVMRGEQNPVDPTTILSGSERAVLGLYNFTNGVSALISGGENRTGMTNTYRDLHPELEQAQNERAAEMELREIRYNNPQVYEQYELSDPEKKQEFINNYAAALYIEDHVNREDLPGFEALFAQDPNWLRNAAITGSVDVVALQQNAQIFAELNMHNSADTDVIDVAQRDAGRALIDAYMSALDPETRARMDSEALNSSAYRNWATTHSGTLDDFRVQQFIEYKNIEKSVSNLDLANLYTVENLLTGAHDTTQAHQYLDTLDGFSKTILFFNNISQGATKRGNDLLMSNYTNCTGDALWTCEHSENYNAWNVVRGSVMQGAAPATAAVLIAALPALPLAGAISGVGAGAFTAAALTTGAGATTILGTAVGIAGTTMSTQQVAEYCTFDGNMTSEQKTRCGFAIGNTVFAAVSTGVGVAAGGQAVEKALLQVANRAVEGAVTTTTLTTAVTKGIEAGEKAFSATANPALQAVNRTMSAAGIGLFGGQAIYECGQVVRGAENASGLNCATNIALALVSAARFATANIEVQAVQKNVGLADVGVNSVQTVISCATLFRPGSADIAGCVQSALGTLVQVGGESGNWRNPNDTPTYDETTTASVRKAMDAKLALYDEFGNQLPSTTRQQIIEANTNLTEAMQRQSIELAQVRTSKLLLPDSNLTGYQRQLQTLLEEFDSLPAFTLGEPEAVAIRRQQLTDQVTMQRRIVEAEIQMTSALQRGIGGAVDDLLTRIGLGSSESKAYQQARQEYLKIAQTEGATPEQLSPVSQRLQETQRALLLTSYNEVQRGYYTQIEAKNKTIEELQQQAIELQKKQTGTTGEARGAIDRQLSDLVTQIRVQQAEVGLLQQRITLAGKWQNNLSIRVLGGTERVKTQIEKIVLANTTTVETGTSATGKKQEEPRFTSKEQADLIQKGQQEVRDAVAAEVAYGITRDIFDQTRAQIASDPKLNSVDVSGEILTRLGTETGGETGVYRQAYDQAKTMLERYGYTDPALIEAQAKLIATQVETSFKSSRQQIQFAYLQSELVTLTEYQAEIKRLQGERGGATPERQAEIDIRLSEIKPKVEERFSSILGTGIDGKPRLGADGNPIDLRALDTASAREALLAETTAALSKQRETQGALGTFEDYARQSSEFQQRILQERTTLSEETTRIRSEMDRRLEGVTDSEKRLAIQKEYEGRITQAEDRFNEAIRGIAKQQGERLTAMEAAIRKAYGSNEQAALEQIRLLQKQTKQLTLLDEISSLERQYQAVPETDTARRATLQDRITKLQTAEEIIYPSGLDPQAKLRFEVIMGDTELRLGLLDREFRNYRTNQLDTMTALLGSNRQAVELTTAGGKTVVLTAMLRVDVEVFGRDKGIYVTRKGQADALTPQVETLLTEEGKAIRVTAQDVQNSNIRDLRAFAKRLDSAEIVLIEPEDLAFIRNQATMKHASPEMRALVIEIYEKLTRNVGLGVDELQLAFDPTVQMINPPSGVRSTVPPEVSRNAELMLKVLTKVGIMASGQPDLWMNTDSFGRAIITETEVSGTQQVRDARFTKSAREAIIDQLVVETGYSRDTFDQVITVKDQLTDLSGTAFAARCRELGVNPQQATHILDLFDTMNSYASGLTYPKESAFFRTKLEGSDRVTTIPGTQGSRSDSQTYTVKMQAVMEGIGAYAYGQTPNFDGLTVSPAVAYRSGFHDVVADVMRSPLGAVRAVTGNMAEQFGVIQNSYQMGAATSTEAYVKIFGDPANNVVGRLAPERTFATQRTDIVEYLAQLKRSGGMDISGKQDLPSNGNAKLVMAGDVQMSPLELARQLALSGAYAADTTWVIQDGGINYYEVQFDSTGAIKPGYADADGRPTRLIENATGGDGALASRYKSADTHDLVTIIGRGGATGDNIPTPDSVPGVTITTMDTPSGVVVQGGSRLDRGDGIARQYLLVVSDDAPSFNSNRTLAPAGQEFFESFRVSADAAQTRLEQSNTAFANTLGLESAATRPLADIVFRYGKDPSPAAQRIADWASDKLLELSTKMEGRDVAFETTTQTTLEARNKLFVSIVRGYESLFADPANQSMLTLIKSTSPDLYERMSRNKSALDGLDGKAPLAYAAEDTAGTSKSTSSRRVANQIGQTNRDAPLLSSDLLAYRESHNTMVRASSESQYQAGSSAKVEVNGRMMATQSDVGTPRVQGGIEQAIRRLPGGVGTALGNLFFGAPRIAPRAVPTDTGPEMDVGSISRQPTTLYSVEQAQAIEQRVQAARQQYQKLDTQARQAESELAALQAEYDRIMETPGFNQSAEQKIDLQRLTPQLEELRTRATTARDTANKAQPTEEMLLEGELATYTRLSSEQTTLETKRTTLVARQQELEAKGFQRTAEEQFEFTRMKQDMADVDGQLHTIRTQISAVDPARYANQLTILEAQLSQARQLEARVRALEAEQKITEERRTTLEQRGALRTAEEQLDLTRVVPETLARIAIDLETARRASAALAVTQELITQVEQVRLQSQRMEALINKIVGAKRETAREEAAVVRQVQEAKRPLFERISSSIQTSTRRIRLPAINFAPLMELFRGLFGQIKDRVQTQQIQQQRPSIAVQIRSWFTSRNVNTQISEAERVAQTAFDQAEQAWKQAVTEEQQAREALSILGTSVDQAAIESARLAAEGAAQRRTDMESIYNERVEQLRQLEQQQQEIQNRLDGKANSSIYQVEMIGRESQYGGLSGEQVSRQHLLVYRDPKTGVVYIADNNSANGTFLNGKQITGFTLVSVGDKIMLSDAIDGSGHTLNVVSVNGKIELESSLKGVIRGKQIRSTGIVPGSNEALRQVAARFQGIPQKVNKPELKSRIEIHGDEYLGKELTVDELYRLGLDPQYGMVVDGVQFYISKPYDIGQGRIAYVVYVQNGVDGSLIARSYYRSNSSVTWRYLVGYTLDESNKHISWYSKGLDEEGINAPAQLQQGLTAIAASERVLTIPFGGDERVFGGTARGRRFSDSYIRSIESSPIILAVKSAYQSGYGLAEPETLGFENPDDGPDFTQYVASWTEETDLYGTIIKDVFLSKNGKYTFVFYRDSQGRAGISFVETKSPIESHGIRRSWVSIGDLSTPIMEYGSQSGGYGNINIRKGHYVDMYSLYLSKIPIIQAYQQAIAHGVQIGVQKPSGEEAATLQETIVEIKSKIAEAQQERDTLKPQIATLKQETDRLQREYQQLLTKNKQYADAQFRLDRAIKNLNRTVNESTKAYSHRELITAWIAAWHQSVSLDPHAKPSINIARANTTAITSDLSLLQERIRALQQPQTSVNRSTSVRTNTNNTAIQAAQAEFAEAAAAHKAATGQDVPALTPNADLPTIQARIADVRAKTQQAQSRVGSQVSAQPNQSKSPSMLGKNIAQIVAPILRRILDPIRTQSANPTIGQRTVTIGVLAGTPYLIAKFINPITAIPWVAHGFFSGALQFTQAWKTQTAHNVLSFVGSYVLFPDPWVDGLTRGDRIIRSGVMVGSRIALAIADFPLFIATIVHDVTRVSTYYLTKTAGQTQTTTPVIQPKTQRANIPLGERVRGLLDRLVPNSTKTKPVVTPTAPETQQPLLYRIGAYVRVLPKRLLQEGLLGVGGDAVRGIRNELPSRTRIHESVTNSRDAIDEWYGPLTKQLRSLFKRSKGCTSSLLVSSVYAQDGTDATCSITLSAGEELFIRPPVVTELGLVDELFLQPVVIPLQPTGSENGRFSVSSSVLQQLEVNEQQYITSYLVEKKENEEKVRKALQTRYNDPRAKKDGVLGSMAVFARDRGVDLSSMPNGVEGTTLRADTGRLIEQEAQRIIDQLFNSDTASKNPAKHKSITDETMQFISLLRKAVEEGSLPADFALEDAIELVRENIIALGLQDRAASEVTLGDHGIRHLIDHNITTASKILDLLEAQGVTVTAMDRLLIHQTMIYHDMGYAMGPVRDAMRQEGSIGQDTGHNVLAAQYVRSRLTDSSDVWSRVFGANATLLHRGVLYHDKNEQGDAGIAFTVGAEGNTPSSRLQNLESAVRTADNTHAFEDKLPELLYIYPESLKYLRLMKAAADVNDETLFLQLRFQLAQAIQTNTSLTQDDKEALLLAILGEGNEDGLNAKKGISTKTYSFVVGRICGNKPQFTMDATGRLQITIEESAIHQEVVGLFALPSYKQLTKFITDLDKQATVDFDQEEILTRYAVFKLRVSEQKATGITDYQKRIQAIIQETRFLEYFRADARLQAQQTELQGYIDKYTSEKEETKKEQILRTIRTKAHVYIGVITEDTPLDQVVGLIQKQIEVIKTQRIPLLQKYLQESAQTEFLEVAAAHKAATGEDIPALAPGADFSTIQARIADVRAQTHQAQSLIQTSVQAGISRPISGDTIEIKFFIQRALYQLSHRIYVVKKFLERTYEPSTKILRGIFNRLRGCGASLFRETVYADTGVGVGCSLPIPKVIDTIIQPPVIPLVNRLFSMVALPVDLHTVFRSGEGLKHINIVSEVDLERVIYEGSYPDDRAGYMNVTSDGSQWEYLDYESEELYGYIRTTQISIEQIIQKAGEGGIVIDRGNYGITEAYFIHDGQLYPYPLPDQYRELNDLLHGDVLVGTTKTDWNGVSGPKQYAIMSSGRLLGLESTKHISVYQFLRTLPEGTIITDIDMKAAYIVNSGVFRPYPLSSLLLSGAPLTNTSGITNPMSFTVDGITYTTPVYDETTKTMVFPADNTPYVLAVDEIRQAIAERNATQLIAAFSKTPYIAALFNLTPGGDGEGYSVSSHTRAMLQAYLDRQTFITSPLLSQDDFIMLFLLRDLPKALAYVLEKKPEQYYTYVAYVVPYVAHSLGITPEKTELFTHLIGQDILGMYIRGEISDMDAMRQIQSFANKFGSNEKQIYTLLEYLYMMDTLAYTKTYGGSAVFDHLYTSIPPGELPVFSQEIAEKFMKIKRLLNAYRTITTGHAMLQRTQMVGDRVTHLPGSNFPSRLLDQNAYVFGSNGYPTYKGKAMSDILSSAIHGYMDYDKELVEQARLELERLDVLGQSISGGDVSSVIGFDEGTRELSNLMTFGMWAEKPDGLDRLPAPWMGLFLKGETEFTAGAHFQGVAAIIDPRVEKPFVAVDDEESSVYVPEYNLIYIVPSEDHKRDLLFYIDSYINVDGLASRIFTLDQVVQGKLADYLERKTNPEQTMYNKQHTDFMSYNSILALVRDVPIEFHDSNYLNTSTPMYIFPYMGIIDTNRINVVN